MAKRTVIKRWTATKGFYFAGVMAGSVKQIAGVLYNLSRDVTVTLKRVSASFGLTDDPTDERISAWIEVVDPQSLIKLVTESLGNSAWKKIQTWRSIGTDAGPVAVIDNYSQEDYNVDYRTIADDETSVLAILVNSTTTSLILLTGSAEMDIEYRQHTYNNFEGNTREEVELWWE